jgi:WD40 repeat protein
MSARRSPGCMSLWPAARSASSPGKSDPACGVQSAFVAGQRVGGVRAADHDQLGSEPSASHIGRIFALRGSLLPDGTLVWHSADVVFGIDDLAGWLIEQVADTARRRLTNFFLGSEQERALREAARAAISLAARELQPDDPEAEHLTMIISQVFANPLPEDPPERHETWLQALRAGIIRQIAILDDPELTEAGVSSSDISGVAGTTIAEILADHFIRQIIDRSVRGGPLEPIAAQLNHDRTYSLVADLAQDMRRALPRPKALAAYRDFVWQIQSRTRHFQGREYELEQLADFSHGTAVLLLLLGDQYAGKTTLLAEFVARHVPSAVDVICYFASRSLSDADSSKFLTEVVAQLADLLEVPAPDALPSAFRSLWRSAARRARATGRHILLVVDGLDESVAIEGLPSIAELLRFAGGVEVADKPSASAVAGNGPPTGGPTSAHVLVSYRLGVSVPAEISGHQPMILQPYSESRFDDAEELNALKRLGPDAWVVLAAIAAAGGPLSSDDIVGITGISRRRLQKVVGQMIGSLNIVGSPDEARYALRSASLLERARRQPDLNLGYYQNAIFKWADRWQAQGWRRADGVPRYLLDEYPDTLAPLHNKRAALLSNVGWIVAAIEQVSVDPVIAHLRACVAASPGDQPPKAMLAVVRSLAPYFRSQLALKGSDVARQLCLQAAELGNSDLAAAFQSTVGPDPGLELRWTTRRQRPALIADVIGDAGWVNAVSLMADGVVVAGADDGRVWIWDAATTAVGPVTLGRHEGPVRALAVLDDGRIVSGGHDHRILLWDPDSPAHGPVTLGYHEGAVRALAVRRDGVVVSGGDDARVRAWNANAPDGVPIELGRHAGVVRGLTVDRDGRVISGADDQRLRVWDVGTPGQLVTQTRRLGWRILTVAREPGGSVMAAGTDYGIYRWNYARADAIVSVVGLTEQSVVAAEFGSHHNVVRSVQTTDDGAVISGSDDGRILVWQASYRGLDRIELGGHDGPVRTLSAVREDRLASGGKDQHVRLWDLRGRTAGLHEPGARPTPFSAVALNEHGCLVAGDSNGVVWLWPTAEPFPAVRLGSHDCSVLSLACLPDGRVASSGSDGKVIVWKEPGGTPVSGQVLGSHHGSVMLALADGRLVSGGYDGHVVLHAPDRPGRPVALGRQGGPVTAITAIKDGVVCTSGTDGTVRAWNPDRLDEARDYDAPGQRINALASLAGFLIGGGDDGGLVIWNPDGRLTATVPAHGSSWLTSLAALSTGYLVSGGTDGRILLWRWAGHSLLPLSGIASAARCLAARLNDDGRETIAIAHADAGLSSWTISTS